MEEELITKKELLALTGISYGSLYRWKRKGLIPAQWFIHRSTYTGQETFFPREKILTRIEDIQSMKEGMSLEDIAHTFSPAPAEVSYSPQSARQAGVAGAEVIDLYMLSTGEAPPFGFDALLRLYIFNSLLQGGQVGREDALAAVALMGDASRGYDTLTLVVIRKLGVTVALLTEEHGRFFAEPGAKIVLKQAVSVWMAKLKEQLQKAQ